MTSSSATQPSTAAATLATTAVAIASAKEKKHLKEFNHVESTHNLVVSNSVGTALLELYQIYCKVKDIDTLAEESKDQLRALAKERENFKPAIEYILHLTTERVSVWDTVVLSIKEEKDFKEVRHVFPLKEVLALVWVAIHDHEKFAHNYSGNEAEKLEQAKRDFPERLSNFLNCIERIRIEKVCHHGNRNELVFILNGVYKGVHLLEDEKTTLLSFLRDNIHNKFWGIYREEKTAAGKRKLATLAFDWMQKADASVMLKTIDPLSTIPKALHDLFIKNGVNPQSIHLDKRINETLVYLEFSCNPTEHKIFHRINIILNYSDKEPAIVFVKKWIVEKCHPEQPADQEKIEQFYTLYQAYTDIIQHEYLLRISGNDFSDLKKVCEDYLATIQSKEEFPPIPAGIRVKFEELTPALQKAKSNLLIPEIENYFYHWFKALKGNDLASKKFFYTMFVRAEFITKVMLTDAQILKALKPSTSPTETDMSPYLVNRLFLQAIFEPTSMSKIFKHAFRETLKFVKNQFNGNLRQTAKDLKRDSYPDELLNQLTYIGRKSKEVDAKAPTSVIVAPGQYKTIEDLTNFFKLLDEKESSRIYSIYGSKINTIILAGNKLKAIETLPIHLRFQLTKQMDIKKLIQSSEDIGVLIGLLPPTDVTAFLEESLGLDFIKLHIRSWFNFCDTFVKVPKENQRILLNYYIKNKIIDALPIFKSWHEVVMTGMYLDVDIENIFLHHLRNIKFIDCLLQTEWRVISHSDIRYTPRARVYFGILPQEGLLQEFPTPADLYTLMSAYHEDFKMDYLRAFTGDTLTKIFQNFTEVASFANDLNPTRFAEFFKLFTDQNFRQFFPDAKQLFKNILLTPLTLWEPILGALSDEFVRELFPNRDMFIALLKDELYEKYTTPVSLHFMNSLGGARVKEIMKKVTKAEDNDSKDSETLRGTKDSIAYHQAYYTFTEYAKTTSADIKATSQQSINAIQQIFSAQAEAAQTEVPIADKIKVLQDKLKEQITILEKEKLIPQHGVIIVLYQRMLDTLLGKPDKPVISLKFLSMVEEELPIISAPGSQDIKSDFKTRKTDSPLRESTHIPTPKAKADEEATGAFPTTATAVTNPLNQPNKSLPDCMFFSPVDQSISTQKTLPNKSDEKTTEEQPLLSLSTSH